MVNTKEISMMMSKDRYNICLFFFPPYNSAISIHKYVQEDHNII